MQPTAPRTRTANLDRPVRAIDGRAFDPRMAAATAAALVAVGVAQAADLVTFLRMVAIVGIEAELNPLVAAAQTTLGTPGVVVAKAALVVLVVAAFSIIARVHRRLAAGVATVATLAGLVGAVSNFLALL